MRAGIEWATFAPQVIHVRVYALKEEELHDAFRPPDTFPIQYRP
jgi:hypothetical protein